jgi:hypothetical protein
MDIRVISSHNIKGKCGSITHIRVVLISSFVLELRDSEKDANP